MILGNSKIIDYKDINQIISNPIKTLVNDMNKMIIPVSIIDSHINVFEKFYIKLVPLIIESGVSDSNFFDVE